MRYSRSDGGTRFRRSILLFLLVALIPMFGCSVTVPISRPTPSSFQYSVRQEAPVTVVVKDSRPESEKKLAKGRFDVRITGFGEDLTFLGEELAKELNARGISAVAGASGAAGPDTLLLDVDRFYIRHHRATGYSPWVTFTNFRAKAVYRGTQQRVAAYFHAGKVPIWSISEIVEPTYNYPISVVIKEIATKLNRLYFRSSPPADLVRRKIDEIKKEPDLKAILEVGFLGSSDALPTLESLVKTDSSGNVVTYALNAIGIIGDPKSFPFLRDFHEASRSKGLLFSLKAIGDLGTPEALAFLRAEPAEEHGNLREIVELYTY
jgi:hypothetical protein